MGGEVKSVSRKPIVIVVPKAKIQKMPLDSIAQLAILRKQVMREYNRN
jgi:hypothetical protein